MKKNKSISNWMNSALKNHPMPTANKIPAGLPYEAAARRGNKKPSQLVEINSTIPGDEVEDMPWCQKYTPLSMNDLAVHKKKVAEVQHWLEFAFSNPNRSGGQLMLLLVGPPGCGKTATIRALAREMGCTILEWANPVTDVGGSEADPQPGDLVFYTESQTKQFQSFIARANRYPALQLGVASGCGLAEKKIVVVEDFPNAFLREARRFHEIMKALAPSLHHPLVFIVSDSHQRDSSAHSLFSASQHSIDIHTISFNPVAHTSLVKTLLRIADTECAGGGGGGEGGVRNKRVMRERGRDVLSCNHHIPSREVIEQLAESSVGDIRAAINALQFTCRTGGVGGVEVKKGQRSTRLKRTRLGSTSGTKMKRHLSSDGGDSQVAVGGRDSSLFLFRALGKILYCKRETEVEVMEEEGATSERRALPAHLQHHHRPRLLVDPEWVVEHSHLSPEMFTLYLHQNYLHMHSTHSDNIVRATDYLSSSDVLSSFWTDSQAARASLLSASCSLACRGLIHTAEHHTSGEGGGGGGGGGGGRKWRPLHKPQWISVHRTYRESCRTVKRLFLHLGQSPDAHLWTPLELQTEIIPHLALTNHPLRNPDQAALLQSMTNFSHGYNSRGKLERLGERDGDLLLTQESTVPSGSSMESVGGGGGSQDVRVKSLFQSISQDVGMGPDNCPEEEVEIEDFDDDMIW